MKLAAKTVLIGVLLLGSAHAAQHDAASGVTGPRSDKGLDRVAAAQPGQAAGKTSGADRGKKPNQAGMALWREKLFAVMSRNVPSATVFFKIPTNRVVELGTRIEL